MARQDILLVGLDYNSLRILEVSLRKAGFMVASVIDYPDAIEQIRIAVPDLIIVDSVRDAEAFEFATSVKRDFKNVPVILISSNKEINARIRALEIGIDDYLVKPVYIKEIIARIKIHLQKQEQKRVEEGITAGFIGSLSDIGLYDIIQTIELNKKSGILEIKGKVQDGRIFFKNGQIVQASVGKLRGEYAVYRMMTFNEGIFKMSFLNIDIKPEINMPNSALIMEGMRRLDEYMKYTEQLPPLTTRLEVDVDLLAKRLKDIPDNVNKVLKLVEGERSINDIIELSELDELETLKIISALYFDQIIYDIFSKRESKEAERKISSTLPEPLSGAILGNNANKEIRRPSTSESWVEKIFEKEVRQEKESEIKKHSAMEGLGNVTITDSNKVVVEPMADFQINKEEKFKAGSDIVEKVSEEERKERIEKKQEEPPGIQSPPISLISDSVDGKSAKERLIEKTLLENVALSTTSYVKGTLLGKKDKKVDADKRSGKPIRLFLVIVVCFVVVFGIYLGYSRYFSSIVNKQGKVRIEHKEEIVLREIQSEQNVQKKQGDRDESDKGLSESKIREDVVDKREEEIDKDIIKGESKEQRPQEVKVDVKEKPSKGREVIDRQAEIIVDMDGYYEHLKSAQGMYKVGNLKDAKEELKKALIKNPKGFEAFTLLGQIDLEANKIKSAITYLRRAISYNGRYAPAYFYLGTCYQLDGNNDGAKKMYQRYLMLAPNGEFANDVRAIISDLK